MASKKYIIDTNLLIDVYFSDFDEKGIKDKVRKNYYVFIHDNNVTEVYVPITVFIECYNVLRRKKYDLLSSDVKKEIGKVNKFSKNRKHFPPAKRDIFTHFKSVFESSEIKPLGFENFSWDDILLNKDDLEPSDYLIHKMTNNENLLLTNDHDFTGLENVVIIE